MRLLGVVIASLLVIFVGIALYFLLLQTADNSAVLSQNNSPTQPLATSTTSSGLLYTNETYKFSLLHPDTLTIQEYDEGYDTMTLVFEDSSTGAGFQIFITPYLGTTISEARFKKDQPSGIMEEPTDVTIDGVRATMFFGRDPAMGETREVWFIKNKFLYEVTTYKALDGWLAEIMQGWKFL